MKHDTKEGYIWFEASGTMKPAVLKIFPYGILVVEWCSENLRGKVSNGPEYQLEENKFGATTFITTEA